MFSHKEYQEELNKMKNIYINENNTNCNSLFMKTSNIGYNENFKKCTDDNNKNTENNKVKFSDGIKLIDAFLNETSSDNNYKNLYDEFLV